LRRFATRIVVSAVAALAAAHGAEAQSCFSLQAEMMHLLSQGDSGSGERSRFDRAYREQAEVIARTERHARSAGCFGGFFLFRREQSGMCQSLIPRLREMQDNLARLDQLRRGGNSERDYRIRELRTVMRNNGCDLPGRSIFEASPDRRWLWEDDTFYQSRGTYRTLCVRTCDGYYFPISFSTVPDQFTADAQACQAMCPGAQAELYYHPNPGGGPESMMSIIGQPYSSLPTAFQDRTSYNPECSCRPPGGYAVAASAVPQSLPRIADTTAPLPRPRPAPGEDPETLANRAGDFVPHIVAAEENPETAALVTGANGRSVRIVGPLYWGKSENDGVIIAPVPN
jgi:hypothetical protein